MNDPENSYKEHASLNKRNYAQTLSQRYEIEQTRRRAATQNQEDETTRNSEQWSLSPIPDAFKASPADLSSTSNMVRGEHSSAPSTSRKGKGSKGHLAYPNIFVENHPAKGSRPERSMSKGGKGGQGGKGGKGYQSPSSTNMGKGKGKGASISPVTENKDSSSAPSAYKGSGKGWAKGKGHSSSKSRKMNGKGGKAKSSSDDSKGMGRGKGKGWHSHLFKGKGLQSIVPSIAPTRNPARSVSPNTSSTQSVPSPPSTEAPVPERDGSDGNGRSPSEASTVQVNAEEYYSTTPSSAPVSSMADINGNFQYQSNSQPAAVDSDKNTIFPSSNVAVSSVILCALFGILIIFVILLRRYLRRRQTIDSEPVKSRREVTAMRDNDYLNIIKSDSHTVATESCGSVSKFSVAENRKQNIRSGNKGRPSHFTGPYGGGTDDGTSTIFTAEEQDFELDEHIDYPGKIRAKTRKQRERCFSPIHEEHEIQFDEESKCSEHSDGLSDVWDSRYHDDCLKRTH